MAGYQPRHDTDPVWFNGTQINNLSVTSQQTGVRITAVHGWDERPDVRDVRELRAGQDGEYADNLYLGGRTITVEGEVYGSTWANLQSRKRALAATFQPTSDEVLFKIPDPATASPTAVYATTGMTGYERVSCRVIEAIRFGDTLDPCCQTFQVVLRASDPRVYSDVATSTDSGTTGTAARTVTVDQTGTYETPTTITVTGPTGDSWQVSAGELSLGANAMALAATETMTFDVLERTVTYGASYSTVRLDTSAIIAQWMLNETVGSTADNAQGNASYDATYTGGYTLNQSGHAASIASVLLNGSTGYVARSYVAALNPAQSSIECWVKWTSGQAGIIDNTDPGNGGYVLAVSASGELWIYLAGGGSALSTTSQRTGVFLTASTWTQLVLTFDADQNTAVVYKNGLQVCSRSLASLAVNGSAAMWLGRSDATANTTGYFNGNFGPTTLWGRVLSAADVADLYSASAAITSLPGYTYLDATSARWELLPAASTTFTLASSGLNTGSKLNVTYRDARI